jgi:hypothetical protein
VTRDQAVLLAVGGLALVCLLLLVVVLRLRAGAARSRAQVEALSERLERLETQAVEAAPAPSPAQSPGLAGTPVEFVITDLGAHVEPEATPVPPAAPAFADIVVKETVVMAASLAHGLRRGLAPGTRNRIRFEMKQEVRRSRKQRRSDLKAAQRDLHARQRAAMAGDTEAAS